MTRIRVYPHNDLFNLANYQRGIINSKLAKDIEEDIVLDCLSCIISMAFCVEALVNFVGHRKIENWNERSPFRIKIDRVCNVCGLSFDQEQEPFATLWQLKQARDMIAHGQPYEANVEIHSNEELHEALEPGWNQHLTPEFINYAYERITEFKHDLLRGAHITIGSTLTSSTGPRLTP